MDIFQWFAHDPNLTGMWMRQGNLTISWQQETWEILRRNGKQFAKHEQRQAVDHMATVTLGQALRKTPKPGLDMSWPLKHVLRPRMTRPLTRASLTWKSNSGRPRGILIPELRWESCDLIWFWFEFKVESWVGSGSIEWHPDFGGLFSLFPEFL